MRTVAYNNIFNLGQASSMSTEEIERMIQVWQAKETMQTVHANP